MSSVTKRMSSINGSECRPIPIPRNARAQTLTHPHIPLPEHTTHTRSLPRTAHRRRRWLISMRALAITPAAPRNLPALKVPPAVLTSSRTCAFGMVIGVLVEGNGVQGVRVAEDVAAAPTVVSTREVGEVALAGCFIADCGFGIWLLRELIS